MIVGLQAHGLALEPAVLAVLVFRLGTTWFSVALGLLTAWTWRARLMMLVRSRDTRGHFDSIADEYETELPAHVRERLLGRKVEIMRRRLNTAGILPGSSRGLDFGCGQGWYTCAMARMGYDMVGTDVSDRQLDHARRHADAQSMSAVQWDLIEDSRLPFSDGCFDFAFAINVLHHVGSKVDQEAALAEIVRVLRPGGILFLQEMNTINPLFRFYMGYLYPLIRAIDEGTEQWMNPRELPTVRTARWMPDIDCFTFLPDFVPGFLMRRLAGVEAWLERSRWRHWSAHYVARLVKETA
jgi:2-polyprenyl-3-methyl-5-hydroxy-6-metoxy-1,4-benzoquinol methylase